MAPEPANTRRTAGGGPQWPTAAAHVIRPSLS